MPDLLISKGRHRAYVMGESARGVRWLQANVILDDPKNKHVAIQSDLVDDFVDWIKKDDHTLIVEVK